MCSQCVVSSTGSCLLSFYQVVCNKAVLFELDCLLSEFVVQIKPTVQVESSTVSYDVLIAGFACCIANASR